VKLSGKVEPS